MAIFNIDEQYLRQIKYAVENLRIRVVDISSPRMIEKFTIKFYTFCDVQKYADELNKVTTLPMDRINK